MRLPESIAMIRNQFIFTLSMLNLESRNYIYLLHFIILSKYTVKAETFYASESIYNTVSIAPE